MSLRLGIFIPCYNASSTVNATLSSVQEAIKMTSLEIPVFLYDDCSTDDSINIAKKSWYLNGKFSVVKNKRNSGERVTTNTAFNDFRDNFDWIFIIHADDIAKEDWLTTLIGFIREAAYDTYFTIWSSYDSFSGSSGKVIHGDNSGGIEQVIRSYDRIKYFLTKVYCNWHISGASINVNLFNQLRGFDEQMAQFGDTDFFVRGLLAGFRDIYISRTLTLYRTSEGSVSSVSLRTNRDIREIFYLINKFKDILTKSEAAFMHRIIRRLSLRRMIKSLKNGNVRSAWINFKQLWKSSLKSI